MSDFQLDTDSGRSFDIRIEEVEGYDPQLARTLIEIDLQTFTEPTFSPYTAAVFLHFGITFLLKADDRVIGTCVCVRAWEHPHEAMILAMGIRPGWRGKGLGEHFVAGVADRLGARGIRRINLLLNRDNRRAFKVYQQVGFEVVEELPIEPLTEEVLIALQCELIGDPPMADLRRGRAPQLRH
ncbi:MAG: GNAT family N-acetyltransferase [Deltaproteobacteria bacterium]|nr:GNAT family N-acetyltransferase [Deltaproteobacteria bacterium]